MLSQFAMAYLARRDTIYDGACFHITWQCHNHSWFLKDNWAKQLYYDLLLKYKDRYGVVIYSYSFMDNHSHLTGKTETVDGLSSMMKAVNSQFARRINAEKSRRGQVVMDRYKSPVIQTDRSLISVMAYIDLNAYRAGKVKCPGDYRWSSYRFYAYGETDPLITFAPSYLALGSTKAERQRRYYEMVDEIMKHDGKCTKDYSYVRFIGDPSWVRQRHDEILEVARIKRSAYLLRQRRSLALLA